MTDQQVDQLLEKLDRIATTLEVLIKGSLQGQVDSTERVLNEQKEAISSIESSESQ